MKRPQRTPIVKRMLCTTMLLFTLLLLDFWCNPTSLRIEILFSYYPVFFGSLGAVLLATPPCITVICAFTNEKVGKYAKAIGGITFTLCAIPFFAALFVIWVLILSSGSISSAIWILLVFLAVFLLLLHVIPIFSITTGNILLSIQLFICAFFYIDKLTAFAEWLILFTSSRSTSLFSTDTILDYCLEAGMFCSSSLFLLFLCLCNLRKPGKAYPISTRILATLLGGISFLSALGALLSIILYLCTFGYTPMRIFGLIAASGMLLLFLGVLLKIHLPERSNHAKRTSDAARL